MNDYPTAFVTHVQPAPASAAQQILQAKGLYIMQGLTSDLAVQLIERSREAHIIEYCPDDAGERFRNLETMAAWLRKGRLALPLVKKLPGGGLRLVGFGWMGSKLPDPTVSGGSAMQGTAVTFTIRIYNEALGQGNALPYTLAILAAHHALYDTPCTIWLEAWGDNPAVQRVYEKAGFIRVHEARGERHGRLYSRIFMVFRPQTPLR